MENKPLIVNVEGEAISSAVETPVTTPATTEAKTGSSAVKPWTGEKLTVSKPDGRSISLVKVEIARAFKKDQAKWTYPGLLANDDKNPEVFKVETVSTFMGAKLFSSLVYDAFDAVLQRCWKDSQDEATFIKNLIDEEGGRKPRSLSARLYTEMQEAKKAHGKLTDDKEKAASKAKITELFAQWRAAQEEEILAGL
jgi:hypothetical protein